MILITSLTVLGFTIKQGSDQHGLGEGLQVINPETFLNIIGFSVYSYEGIGVILPVMDVTADKKKYRTVLFIVITTVFLVYLSFGEFCYIIYGNALKLPLITSNLPEDNILIPIIKIAFCINLVFSYPLVIYPAY